MQRLGYDRYGAAGGDVGSGIAGMLGCWPATGWTRVHVTGPVPFPFGPAIELDGLAGTERLRAERFNAYQQDGLGYLHLQATRPQTLGYLLNDSPVGQLAWIVEKFAEWTDPAAELPEDAVDLDQLLTTVSIYWFTGAGRHGRPLHLRGHAGVPGVRRLRRGHRRDARRTTDRRRGVRRRQQHPVRHRPGRRHGDRGPSTTPAATSPPWRCRSWSSASCRRSSTGTARRPPADPPGRGRRGIGTSGFAGRERSVCDGVARLSADRWAARHPAGRSVVGSASTGCRGMLWIRRTGPQTVHRRRPPATE